MEDPAEDGNCSPKSQQLSLTPANGDVSLPQFNEPGQGDTQEYQCPSFHEEAGRGPKREPAGLAREVGKEH